MASLTQQGLYRDLNLTFNKHPVTGAISVLKDREAVKRAVRNLIMTNFYERPYNPLFGGNVPGMLFENATPMEEHMIFDQIKTTIANWEPRATLDNLIVDLDPDSNSLFIKIIFSIRNDMGPIELDISIYRVR